MEYCQARFLEPGVCFMASAPQWVVQMTPQDKSFYQTLGQRIARFRKAQGFTQVQLAETLGISQQTMAHYEVGRLRIAVAMLPPLSRTLGVSIEDLLDEAPASSRNKRGPVSRLHQQIQQVKELPRAKQKFVSEMLDTVLQQAG